MGAENKRKGDCLGFTVETGISAAAVFLQGILSFLSPCVLPLVPLYISYLAGGAKTVEADGTICYRRGKVMLNTLFFLLGVGFAFFLLGLGFTAIGQFFNDYRVWFSRIGGVLIILFGLLQLGVFGSRFLNRERRLPMRLERFSMNPLVALLLGFTFSFAWTPCVGPALTSVLLMASSSATVAEGFALIGVYTLGFAIPFLAVGLFTSALLGLFCKHRNILRYTVKIGGAVMILMGFMMLTGWMSGLGGFLSSAGNGTKEETSSILPTVSSESMESAAESASSSDETYTIPAPDFTLTDQYGKIHSLSQYRGKVVFLNFWASWCGPCKQEMPDIQALYEQYGENKGDVVILGVANPKTEENLNAWEGTKEEVTDFLKNQEYTYPTVMDETGLQFAMYGVYSLPTTFMIDREGNVFGYVSGALTKEMMESMIQQTQEGKRHT